MSRNRLIALLALTLAVRLALLAVTGYTVDDAYITFRYAENLAAGNGFVYNLGERVLGTSSPLFAIALALGNLIGLSSHFTAVLLSMAAALGVTTLLYQWSVAAGSGRLAHLAPLCYALFPRSVITDICGMETTLFAFFALLCVYGLWRRHAVVASIAASLAAISRPEGLLLLPIVIAFTSANDWRRLGGVLLPMIVLYGSWLVFSLSYFGSAIPNSVAAKSAIYAHQFGSSFGVGMIDLLSLRSPAALVVWTLFLAALIMLARQRFWLILNFSVVACLVGFAASGAHLSFRYAAPFYPFVFMTIGVAAASPIQRWLTLPRYAIPFGSLIIVVAAASYLMMKAGGLSAERRWYETTHAAAGKYVAAHAGAEDRVIAEDIGYFGYAYRGNIIDRDGLVTPAATPYNREARYLAFVDSVKPDWLFLALYSPSGQAIAADSVFRSGYQEVDFGERSGSPTHALFVKRDASR